MANIYQLWDNTVLNSGNDTPEQLEQKRNELKTRFENAARKNGATSKDIYATIDKFDQYSRQKTTAKDDGLTPDEREAVRDDGSTILGLNKGGLKEGAKAIKDLGLGIVSSVPRVVGDLAQTWSDVGDNDPSELSAQLARKAYDASEDIKSNYSEGTKQRKKDFWSPTGLAMGVGENLGQMALSAGLVGGATKGAMALSKGSKAWGLGAGLTTGMGLAYGQGYGQGKENALEKINNTSNEDLYANVVAEYDDWQKNGAKKSSKPEIVSLYEEAEGDLNKMKDLMAENAGNLTGLLTTATAPIAMGATAFANRGIVNEMARQGTGNIITRNLAAQTGARDAAEFARRVAARDAATGLGGKIAANTAIARQGLKIAGKQSGLQMVEEGAQEWGEGYFAADAGSLARGDKGVLSDKDWSEVNQQGLQGAAIGALMGGGGSLLTMRDAQNTGIAQAKARTALPKQYQDAFNAFEDAKQAEAQAQAAHEANPTPENEEALAQATDARLKANNQFSQYDAAFKQTFTEQEQKDLLSNDLKGIAARAKLAEEAKQAEINSKAEQEALSKAQRANMVKGLAAYADNESVLINEVNQLGLDDTQKELLLREVFAERKNAKAKPQQTQTKTPLELAVDEHFDAKGNRKPSVMSSDVADKHKVSLNELLPAIAKRNNDIKIQKAQAEKQAKVDAFNKSQAQQKTKDVQREQLTEKQQLENTLADFAAENDTGSMLSMLEGYDKAEADKLFNNAFKTVETRAKEAEKATKAKEAEANKQAQEKQKQSAFNADMAALYESNPNATYSDWKNVGKKHGVTSAIDLANAWASLTSKKPAKNQEQAKPTEPLTLPAPNNVMVTDAQGNTTQTTENNVPQKPKNQDVSVPSGLKVDVSNAANTQRDRGVGSYSGSASNLIVRQDGKPFPTEQVAQQALANKATKKTKPKKNEPVVTKDTHTVVPVDGGYAIAPVEEVKPVVNQEMTESKQEPTQAAKQNKSEHRPLLEEAYAEVYAKPIEDWDANDFATIGAQAYYHDGKKHTDKEHDADNALVQKLVKKIINDGIKRGYSTLDIMSKVMFGAFDATFTIRQSGVDALRAYIEMRKEQVNSTTSPTVEPIVTKVEQPIVDDLSGDYAHSQFPDATATVAKTEKGYDINWGDEVQSFTGKNVVKNVKDNDGNWVKQDKPVTAESSHIENGKIEEITGEVIRESLAKVDDKPVNGRTMSLKEAKQWLLDSIDVAIAVAPKTLSKAGRDAIELVNDLEGKIRTKSITRSEEDKKGIQDARNLLKDLYITFDVPNDGKFKVLNTIESLQRFKANVEKTKGFTENQKQAKPFSAPSENSPETTIMGFLNDGELENAYFFAENQDKPIRFALSNKKEPIAYFLTEPVDLGNNITGFVGISIYPMSKSKRWLVIEEKTRTSIGFEEISKRAAIKSAKARVSALKKEDLEGWVSKITPINKTDEEMKADWLAKNNIKIDEQSNEQNSINRKTENLAPAEKAQQVKKEPQKAEQPKQDKPIKKSPLKATASKSEFNKAFGVNESKIDEIAKDFERKSQNESEQSIGKNSEGKDLYEDSRGVRYYKQGGAKVFEDVAISGKGMDLSNRTDEYRTVEEVAERQPKQPTKKERLLIKIDDELDAALDDFAAIFKEQGKRLSSGVDPVIMGKVLAIGMKASTLYLAKGAVKFSIWAENMIASLSSKGVSQDLVEPYLKGLYAASKMQVSPEIRQQMDKEDDVYDFDFATLNVGQEEAADSIKKTQTTKKTLTDLFYDHLKKGTLPENNAALRKMVAEFDGKEVDNYRLKEAQEMLEAAMARYSRDVVTSNQNGDASTFNQLVDSYNKQPNLNIRTSTSVENQAYSTPAPLAFVAAKMANIGKSTKVYEPTAGNGMLLITALPENATVNEMESTRFNNLKAQGFNAHQGDALKAIENGVIKPSSQDAIITNPPFGSIKENGKTIKVEVDGYKIGKIDHLIAAEALKAMKPNGTAAIIIGADMVQGGISTDDRIFFNWLYSNYNVVSHFEVDGKLYSRQGASWPVRVIIVHGKQESNSNSPVTGAIPRYDNWKDVYDQYIKMVVASNNRGLSVGTRGSDNRVENDTATTQPINGVETTQTGARGRNTTRNNDDVGGVSSRDVSNRPRNGGKQLRDSDNVQRFDERTNVQDNLAVGDNRDTGGATRDNSGVGRWSKPNEHTGKDVAVLSDADNSFQVKYTPASSRKDEGVLIPINMRQPLMDSLLTLEDSVGDIDKYAAKELGYRNVEQLHDALMGLQVDSVASAIYQIKEKNKGIIIADQTGIGKGRQAAAIIRWAILNGHTPVFVTVKPQLFTDMYGDLSDIGSNNIKPFIVNTGESISGKDGQKLHKTKPDAKHRKEIEDIAADGVLPDEYNAVFITYSQINKANNQQRLLSSLSSNAVFILDESHNAGGASATGLFVQDLLKEAKGVVYLSATFAKRPDNMPLYFKTDMGMAVGETSELSAAVIQGGLPLQTVISNSLVKAGQLFRRERSYNGVSIETKVDSQNKLAHEKLSDEATKALRAIVAADKMFHNTYFARLEKEMEKQGQQAKAAGNKAEKSVSHHEFSSVVHNFIRQMLLGLKVDTAANEAIAALKRGEKPLIALENTMGSFLNEYVSANGLKEGDSLGNFGYRNVLSRALYRTRAVTIKDKKGQETRKEVGLDELDSETRAAYNAAQKIIDSLDISIPASPIDWMRNRLEAAGYSVAEITGRNMAVDYSTKTPTVSQVPLSEQNDKVGTTRMFNNGELDAIILNVAGSTGISLHASEKFKDQRKRHMIVAQPAQDINIFMQMLGRIHRTGQVILPKYTILSLDLPTEKRPTAVLNKKMKSLNANTSSNTESATSIVSLDMLNKYGDKIVASYLDENKDVAKKIGMEVHGSASTSDTHDDFAKKATGRFALLPVAEQNRIYDEIEPQYAALISYLDETGQNELEPKTIDFDAELKLEAIAVPATDPSTPFGQEAIYGEYKVKPQGKPMSVDEVKALIVKNIGEGVMPAQHTQKLLADGQSAFDSFINTLNERYKTAENEEEAGIIQKNIANQQAVFENTKSFIESHRVGSIWQIDIKGDIYNAVITNVKSTFKKGGHGNPFAQSKILISLAVNGELRSVTVPMTEFSRIEVTKYYGTAQDALKPREGDAGLAKIITGNLLAGYANLVGSDGRVISFTKKDGTTEQGILLPKKFNFKDNVRQDFAIKDANDVFKLLKSGVTDILKTGVASRKGDIRIVHNTNTGGITIYTPKSKSTGGKWFLNKKLIDVVGDFVSSGNMMVVNVPSKKAIDALSIVVEKTPLYVLPSQAEATKELLGYYDGQVNLKSGNNQDTDNKPKFSQSSTIGDRTITQVREKLVSRFGKRIIDLLESKGILKIHQSMNTLPKGVLDMARGSEDAAYYNGVVHLIADNLIDENIIPAFVHDLSGHKGFQEMMSPKAYELIMQQFDRLVAQGNSIAIKAKQRAERAEVLTDKEKEGKTDKQIKELEAMYEARQQDEYLPYFLTEQVHQQQTTPQERNAVKRLKDHIVRAVKGWVVRTLSKYNGTAGIAKRVSETLDARDIQLMAERMIKDIAKYEKPIMPNKQSGMARREFLGLLGAGVGVAALGGVVTIIDQSIKNNTKETAKEKINSLADNVYNELIKQLNKSDTFVKLAQNISKSKPSNIGKNAATDGFYGITDTYRMEKMYANGEQSNLIDTGLRYKDDGTPIFVNKDDVLKKAGDTHTLLSNNEQKIIAVMSDAIAFVEGITGKQFKKLKIRGTTNSPATDILARKKLGLKDHDTNINARVEHDNPSVVLIHPQTMANLISPNEKARLHAFQTLAHELSHVLQNQENGVNSNAAIGVDIDTPIMLKNMINNILQNEYAGSENSKQETEAFHVGYLATKALLMKDGKPASTMSKTEFLNILNASIDSFATEQDVIDSFYRKVTFLDAAQFSKTEQAQFDRLLAKADKMIAEQGKLLAPNGKPSKLNRYQWAQVRTDNFKNWFGDWENDPANASQVIDSETKEPMVVYHGTNQNITAFDPARIGLRDAGFFGSGFYSTPDEGFAQDYADTAVEDTGEGEAAAMPLYVSLQNPFIWDMSDEGADATRAALAAAGIKRTSVRGNSAALGNAEERKIFNRAVREQGYDGVIVRDEDGIQEVVAFRPNQIKSATGNSGEFSPTNPDIRFSRGERNKAERAADYVLDSVRIKRQVAENLHAKAELGWWSKTIGTQLNTAKKFKDFDRVYKLLQRLLQHQSSDVMDALEVAPTLLEKLDDWQDLKNQVKAIGRNAWQGAKHKLTDAVTDRMAVAKVIFSETLAKKPLSQAELEQKLTPQQLKIYEEARAAINVSLKNTAKSEIIRSLLQNDVINFDTVEKLLNQQTGFDAFIDEMLENVGARISNAQEELSQAETDVEKQAIKDELKRLADMYNSISDVNAKVYQLIDEAYAPLMRFGDYALTMRDKTTGKVLSFMMFESKAERNRMVNYLGTEYGNTVDLEPDTMSTEDFKMFKGVTPETVALFAKELGLDKNEAYQGYLKLAIPATSALTRRIQRKGTAGYNEDIQRVVSAFVMSNARYSSKNIYLDKVNQAHSKIDSGTSVRDQAKKMIDNTIDPADTFAWLRDLLFVWNLGGSVMFAFWNMTQPFIQTLPMLSQYVGTGFATKHILRGIKVAGAAMTTGNAPKGYEAEYKRAVHEGIVDPQNTFMLTGLERGGTGTTSKAWTTTKHLLGVFAQMSESINRKATLIAALEVANKKGDDWIKSKGYESAYDFAKDVISQTQGVYNKANRSNWAHNPVGAPLLVFKQFSINYVEQMIRMYKNQNAGEEGKKAVFIAMMMLFSLAGGMGLPFIKDIFDGSETIAAFMGNPVNIEREMRLMGKQYLGETTTGALMDGWFNKLVIGEVLGADVQSKTGMGDLIPATNFFNPVLSYSQRVNEGMTIFGAAGGLGEKVGDSIQLMANDEWFNAFVTAAPRFATSMYRGVEMMTTGETTDSKDRKLFDTTFGEGLVKFFDSQPVRMAELSRARGLEYDDIAIQRSKIDYYRSKWVKAAQKGDDDAIEQIEQDIEDWNENNEKYPVIFDRQRAYQSANKNEMTWGEREEKTPKGMEWLNEERPDWLNEQ